MAKFLEMDRSSLEEMAEDLNQIFDDLSWILANDQEKWQCGNAAKNMLKRMRYRLATYLDPVCASCCKGSEEGRIRYTNDGWYCERCVMPNE